MGDILTDLNIKYIKKIGFRGFDAISLQASAENGEYEIIFKGVINFNYSVGDVAECSDDVLSVLDVQHRYGSLKKEDLKFYAYDSLPDHVCSNLHFSFFYEDMILTILSCDIEVIEMK